MSAANPSYDLDALHRAQRAYEPSMEEILASIRNIISEERTGTAQPPAAPAPQAAAAEPAPSAPPIAEQQAAPEQAAPERAEPPAIPRVVLPPPEAETAQEPIATPTAVKTSDAAAPAAREEPLVSPEAHAAIAHSFEALSVGVAVQNSTMIEDAVRDMIRPMLKAWLDDNLPSMVEGLVRAEIQRVARGGR
jgi:cell pole-organizing protein PopZ